MKKIFGYMALVLGLFVFAAMVISFSDSEAGSRYDIYMLRPAPTALGQTVISVPNADSTRFKWGSGSSEANMGLQFGGVSDSTDATGLVVVDITAYSSNYQLFVTPISSLGIVPNVYAQSDTTFTVQFYLNDTAANAEPVQFYWMLNE